MQDQLVSAVASLRDRMGRAPTTGDVAAQLGVSRQYALRVLSASKALFSVPVKPPRWHVRGGLSGAEARLLQLIEEAGELVRGLDPAGAAEMRAQLLDALEGRR